MLLVRHTIVAKIADSGGDRDAFNSRHCCVTFVCFDITRPPFGLDNGPPLDVVAAPVICPVSDSSRATPKFELPALSFSGLGVKNRPTPPRLMPCGGQGHWYY